MIRLPIFMQKVFGVEEIPDKLLSDALDRVKTRCAALDLQMYKRRPAQARLETEAIEAIVGAFRDHYPQANIRVREHWPHVFVTLIGSRASFEVVLGQDYDDGDGIEPFYVDVKFTPRLGIRDVIRKMLHQTPRHEPELELRMQAPEPPKKAMATTAPEPPKSAARSLLDRRR